MKLFGKCTKCKSENSFRSYYATRVDYAMRKGETKKFKCENCGSEFEIHIDEIYAKESKLAQILAALIFLLGTPLTFFVILPALSVTRNNYFVYIIGGLLLVPVIVYGIIKKQDQTRVNSFNRSKLKGRISNI